MPLIVQEQAAPSTPATGYAIVYAKTDGLLYGKDDAGTETKLSNEGAITLGTPQSTTSGTSFDFTGIPSGTKKITITFSGVSLSGTDNLLIQLGDSGGIETTGYSSRSIGTTGAAGGAASSTSGFVIRLSAASETCNGAMELSLHNSSAFTWVSSHSLEGTTGILIGGGGSKSLSAELTQIRLTRSGTDTFDAGAVNLLYQ